MASRKQDSVVEVYQRHGLAWAELRQCHLLEESWLDQFCYGMPAGAAVLDIGCGSGFPIARELVERGYDLIGFDGSETMLALFQRNLPGIPTQLDDMRQMDLKRRFTGILAWDSFFHLSPEDQRSMFPRFSAHAGPKARLMFTSGNAEGLSFGELEGEPLYHGSLEPDEYRSLLSAAGFEVAAHVANDPSFGGRTIWLAHKRCSLD